MTELPAGLAWPTCVCATLINPNFLSSGRRSAEHFVPVMAESTPNTVNNGIHSERLMEPERGHHFRVPWVDDARSGCGSTAVSHTNEHAMRPYKARPALSPLQSIWACSSFSP